VFHKPQNNTVQGRNAENQLTKLPTIESEQNLLHVTIMYDDQLRG